MSVLGPIIKSDDYRQKKSSNGKYTYARLRRAENVKHVEARVIQDFKDGRLDTKLFTVSDSHVLGMALGIDVSQKMLGTYSFRSGLEKWLSEKLSVSQEYVHETLFNQWLDRMGVSDSYNGYSVIVGDLCLGYRGCVTSSYHSVNFASSLELAFILDCVMSNRSIVGITNSPKFAPTYEIEGVTRKYYPDFLVDQDTVVEVKDSRDAKKQINLIKNDACIKFCKVNGFNYELITEQRITRKSRNLSKGITAAWLSKNRGNNATRLG